GGFGTARAMAAFYQMMLGGGRLGAVRLFSKRMIEYVTRDFTGDRPDEAMAGIPMHRGIGPHSRGTGGRLRGLGSIPAPATFAQQLAMRQHLAGMCHEMTKQLELLRR